MSDNFNIDDYLDEIVELKQNIEDQVKDIITKFFIDNKSDFIDLIKLNFIKENPNISNNGVLTYIESKLKEIFDKSFSGESYYFKYLKCLYNCDQVLIIPTRRLRYTKDNTDFPGNKIEFTGCYLYKKFSIYIHHTFLYNKDKDVVIIDNSIDVSMEIGNINLNSMCRKLIEFD